MAEGRFADLCARHYDDLMARARLRVGPDRAGDVVHATVARALGELARGRTYPVPFRAAVHQMLGWAMRDLWGESRHAPLGDDWDVVDEAGEDGFARVVDRITVEGLFERLPEGDRRVMGMRYLDGRRPAEIAEALGMTRNAVDQALWRGRQALKEAFLDG